VKSVKSVVQFFGCGFPRCDPLRQFIFGCGFLPDENVRWLWPMREGMKKWLAVHLRKQACKMLGHNILQNVV
jgi:hypothetical protein